MKYIYLIEKNIHGAWVIYGDIGVNQYYYYTKVQAIKQYQKKCESIFFTNCKD